MLKFTALALLALASSVSAVPLMERTLRMPSETPRERAQLEEMRTRNSPGLMLGGHFNGPIEPSSQRQIDLVRQTKEVAREVQQVHQSEVEFARQREVQAEREARYAKMTPAEAQKARETDRIQDQIVAEGRALQAARQRVNRFKAELERTSADRITAEMTPSEIVAAVELRSIKQTYTERLPNGELSENARKLTRLMGEPPNLESVESLQRALVAKKDLLKSYVDDAASLHGLTKITYTRYYNLNDGMGQRSTTGTDFVFQSEAADRVKALKARGDVSGSGINPVDVAPADKRAAMAFIAKEIMQSENRIHRERIQAIDRQIVEAEKSIREHERSIHDISNRRSERNQVWGADVDSADVDSADHHFVPHHLPHHFRQHKAAKVSVHVNVE